MEDWEAPTGKAGSENLIVFVRRDFVPVQRSYDCAVWERRLSFLKGLYRDIVPQLRAQLLELAFCSYQLINRDQAPVTISGGIVMP